MLEVKNMYYALILVSVALFGANFALQEVYQKMRGDSLKISLQATVFGSLAALVVLLIINKFKMEYTHFTLIIAIVLAVINLAFTFVSFKALSYINLSLYSLFSMLGGMLLPFIQGIIFYGEPLTIAKAYCIVFIIGALLLTINKDSDKKGGIIYYIGVFVLNGLCGVVTKIFTSSSLPKTSSAGLNILVTITAVIISAVILLIFFMKTKTEKPINLKNTMVISASGVSSRIANFLLVIALMHVDASVQYPMVTGGVMIVSTLLVFFRKQKPSFKEVLSVTLAFLGMLVLFIVPV